MFSDRLINRHNTDSIKWAKYANTDIIPMWVADMDLPAAPAILEALHKRVDHAVFGYAKAPDSVTKAAADWINQQHNWQIEPDWIVWLPGLVPALNITTRAFTKPDEQLITFTPIYPPFLEAPENFNRELIRCKLANNNNHFEIDFDKFEDAITEKTKVLLLCSPHNPVGRVWTKQELNNIINICVRKNILICSDEIHCDLVLDKNSTHIPTASLNTEAAQNIITLISPGKTFNLPGLNCGFAIIPNKQIRKQFIKAARGIVPYVNTFGYTACEAAFTHSRPWHEELIEYLRNNRDILYSAIQNGTPQLSMNLPQATYLAWIDIRELNIDNPVDFFEKAGVGLQNGRDFDGQGFVRMNFGCPENTLIEAINRIKNTLK